MMPSISSLRRWREVIGLLLFSVVFASLQWDTLRSLITDGPTAVTTLADISLLVLLLITILGASYETLQLITD